ncbi:MAG: hypothetical protein WC236_05955 [Gallionellaceae bacterium]|jgi:hypothetical protein
MMKFFLISVLSIAAGVGIALFFVSCKSEYLIEEAQISPSEAYLATRFMEVGMFVYCNEVVIVTPRNMPFSSKEVTHYIPYTVFETGCSTRTKIQWTGANGLLVLFDVNDDDNKRKPNDDSLRKTDVSGRVTITYGMLPNPAFKRDSPRSGRAP